MRFWNMVNVLFLAFILAACGENEGTALNGSASATGIYGTTDLFLPDEAGQIGLLAMPERQMRAGGGGAVDFEAIGDVQTFTALYTGDYLLETWGAQGGDDPANPTTVFGGRGGYAKGAVHLTAGTTLYVYVGSQGIGCLGSSWNSTGGGGATDIRLVGGDWKSAEGLYSRIIVAGGGGGRHGKNYEGATYVGNDGGGEVAPTYDTQGVHITGATQTGSGTSDYDYPEGVVAGSFGYGNPNNQGNTCSAGGYNGGAEGSDNWANGGPGGGWYGGVTSWPTSSGGSGYVLTDVSYKPIGYTPGTEYYLNETELIAGNDLMPDPAGGTETGHHGDGFARISSLCPGVTPDPTDVTATPATVGYGDKSQLNATTSGTTIKWYTEPTGGEPIGESASGEDFEVSPEMTMTYYAEASGVSSTQVKNFTYSGAVKTWIVPEGITSIQIETWGAAGWSGDYSGGKGGYAKGTLAVTPGETLYLYVGGQGAVADVPYAPMGGGWNGGGHGQTNDNGANAGGGGGASDIRIGGTTLADRIIVAGGGGGATDNEDCWGGDGGGEIGADGGCSDDYEVGTGGTQSEGGTIGGALGKGGSAKSTMEPWNGGGGGGYYGGGTSPAHGSGGGGSSYIGGVTDGETTAGVRSGHGQITITYTDASISACASSRVPVTVTVGAYAFTNCGQPGQTGPTQGQCDTAYTETALAGEVTIGTQGLQEWVVPVTGTYRIEAYGAEGGTSTGENGSGPYVGGKGAVVKGDFSLNAGDTLHILVGQRGSDSNCGSGGGGGTFIVKDGEPLIVAGGGGGGFHCIYYGSALGGGGQTGTSGQDGICAPGTNPPRTGGTGGNGGTSYFGAGGGGWLTAGTSDYDSGSNAGAYPGDGGVPGGAYGGGGGYYGSCCGGSGGGGGYSGGSGGTLDGCAGGGGGSYNDGADQDNVAGANTGDGKVVITSLCINLPEPTDVIAKPVSISSGESVQLNATTVPGTMIAWYTQETGGVSIGSSASGEDFEVSPTVETTYYAEASPVVYVESTVDLDYTGAVETWVVPAGVTSIEIEAWGAQGGGGSGGLGARMKGTVPVTPGETIKYIVGGQGTHDYGYGGGGGSFVTRADNTPLVIAGGGGGQNYNAAAPGQPGRTETTGGSVGGSAGGADGSGGANGGGSSGCGWFGSGGGGLLTNGSISGDGGGNSFISGGAISVEPAANCVSAGLGGFGGGGAGGNGGGGGGGYSGGAGGTNGDGYLAGAGGGSYNSGTDQSNSAGVRSGNGKITINYTVVVPDPTRCSSKRVPVTVAMCDARTDGPTVIATPDTITSGSSVLLNATAPGATISWYAEEFGGVAIGTSASGEDFEVFPTETTTYYAEASDADSLLVDEFDYTGAVQTWVVPVGVTSIQIEAWGAQGWSGGNAGGLGGYAKGTLAVTPGQVLNLYVGGRGTVASIEAIPMGGGWNGGGHGQSNYSGEPNSVGGGGGASDVRVGGTALTDRVIVAGGGGGATNNTDCWGGDGGGETGLTGGGSFDPGTGGTQSAGGTIGGDLGQGGNATVGMTPWNGGGGGGYYGGGTSPAHGGGGGGSSYIDGVTGGTTTAGLRSGDGQIKISYQLVLCPSLRVPVTVTVKAAPGAECGSNDDCVVGYCTDGVCCGVETCDDDNVCTVDSCAVSGDGTCTNAAGNAGTECRGAAALCDAVEVCDGVNADCPDDVLVAAVANTECRGATGLCDVAEICNGFLSDCPEDDVAATDVVCRPQDGLCDVADNCDGETTECPAYDAVATADVVCRSKDGVCDLDDNCDGTTKGCAEKFVDAGTECRAIAGVCDVTEKCTGAASDCPVDAFAGSSTVCRVSVGICDASEYCSGGGVSCPVENYASVNGGTCDDGDVLTQNDVCLDGGCAGELIAGICGNEISVGALPYTVNGDTGGRLNAMETYGTACANADQPTGDIVYAMDVTEGVEYQIQVVPAEGFDAALNLLNVCGEGEICIGAANTGTDGATEVVLYTADHTGTIYIAVEGGGAGEAGTFELNVAVVEQSDDDAIMTDEVVTDDIVTDDITTDEIAGDSDELSGDSDELLVDADEVVTDEVVTDETVTDNETPDETTDETVTDNETPDETADEAGDGLVADDDNLLTDELLTDTDKPADEACSCSLVF